MLRWCAQGQIYPLKVWDALSQTPSLRRPLSDALSQTPSLTRPLSHALSQTPSLTRPLSDALSQTPSLRAVKGRWSPSLIFSPILNFELADGSAVCWRKLFLCWGCVRAAKMLNGLSWTVVQATFRKPAENTQICGPIICFEICEISRGYLLKFSANQNMFRKEFG
jgi:hypothetical protein